MSRMAPRQAASWRWQVIPPRHWRAAWWRRSRRCWRCRRRRRPSDAIEITMETQSKEKVLTGNVGRYKMDARIKFEGLSSDSREVKPGYLFAALPGTRTNG